MIRRALTLILAVILSTTASVAQSRQDAKSAKATTFDTIIRGGTVYDGNGALTSQSKATGSLPSATSSPHRLRRPSMQPD